MKDQDRIETIHWREIINTSKELFKKALTDSRATYIKKKQEIKLEGVTERYINNLNEEQE